MQLLLMELLQQLQDKENNANQRLQSNLMAEFGKRTEGKKNIELLSASKLDSLISNEPKQKNQQERREMVEKNNVERARKRE